MLFKTSSASVYGIDAHAVEVEVDVGSAYMKDFNVVGLPDNAVKESRERIKSALRTCGFEFPYGQGVTINLAPADLRKEGSGFDLPMALGVVGCQGRFFGKALDKMMFREEDLLQRANGAETDPQALHDFRRGRKATGERGDATRVIGPRPRSDPQGREDDCGPGRVPGHRSEASERGDPVSNAGPELLVLSGGRRSRQASNRLLVAIAA
jgi:hypothetical protein